MKKILTLSFIVCSLSLFSCNKEVEETTIIDDITGLQNEFEQMHFNQVDKTDYSDPNGYFTIVKTFNYGIGNCDYGRVLPFIKKGYTALNFDQSNYISKDSKFVSEGKKGNTNRKKKHCILTIWKFVSW